MSNPSGCLNGKVIIITGAGRGIGREIALLASNEGAKIVVNDLGTSSRGEGSDAGPAQQVVAEIKARGGEAVASVESVAEWSGRGKNRQDGAGCIRARGRPGEQRRAAARQDFSQAGAGGLERGGQRESERLVLHGARGGAAHAAAELGSVRAHDIDLGAGRAISARRTTPRRRSGSRGCRDRSRWTWRRFTFVRTASRRSPGHAWWRPSRPRARARSRVSNG